MKQRTKSSVRKVLIGACLGAIFVLAIFLYLGSTAPSAESLEQQGEVVEEAVEEEITGAVVGEVAEEVAPAEEEITEEAVGEVVEEEVAEEEPEELVSEELVEEEAQVTYGISADYILSKKDCKCYSIDEEFPVGKLDCRGIFGLVGCSDAGIEIKGYMVDSDGNIKEKYLDDLGLA